MSIDLVIKAIRSGTCLPFLGAGASAFFEHDGRRVPGIPLGGQLADDLAKACEYSNGATYDLSKVAEYFVFKDNGNRDELERRICEAISQAEGPRPIHTALAQLEQIRFVITSNYDRLLEDEFYRCKRTPKIHVYEPQNPKTGHFACNVFQLKPRDVILHKMHGSIETPRSMVITQSDYIRYLARLNDGDRGMPELFRKQAIPMHSLLFLGYSLEDWNFRVIWEGVLSSYEDSGARIPSYAIVQSSTEFQRSFWGERKVKIIDHDLTEFAKVLADEFGLEIPQLGIRKPDSVPQGARHEPC